MLCFLNAAFAATMVFDVDGTLVKGDTLALVPVKGAGQVTEIVQVAVQVDGIVQAPIAETVQFDARGGDLGHLKPVAASSSKATETESGWLISGDPVAWTADVAPGATYVGIGAGDERTTQTQFVYGTTSYFTTRGFPDPLLDYSGARSEFVWNTSAYFRNSDGTLSTAQSTVGGLPGAREVVADVGAERCLAGVFDSTGLLYRAEVDCSAIATYASSDGDASKEVPADQHFFTFWSNEYQAMVTQVTWTWSGGGIDVTYHMPGRGWVE